MKLLLLWETVMVGNSTSCRQIQSVITLVINKLDSRLEVNRFC